jgi:hypothetical protein
MAVLAGKRKKYRFGGTMTSTNPDGMLVEHRAGDQVPDEWLAQRTPGEIDALRSAGWLREIGAPPQPRGVAPAPIPPTPLEIIKRFSPGASREGEHIKAAGYALAGADFVLAEKAREKDFERVLATGTTIPIVVHLAAGGWPVATVDLGRLCQLLAARGLVR